MRDKLCDSFRGQGRTPLQNFEMPFNVLLTQQARIKSVLRHGHLAYAVFFAVTVIIARDLLSLVPVNEYFVNAGFFARDELIDSVIEESNVDCIYEDNEPMVAQIIDELVEAGYLQVNPKGQLYSDFIRESCDWPTLKELEQEAESAITDETEADMPPELF